MKTQPAVVTYSPEPYSVEIRETPAPEPGAEEVVVDVAAVGVCGSDLHMWTGQQSWTVNYPCVLGHEFSGVISAVGREVRGWSEGDRVVCETAAEIDPANPLSRRGLYNLDPTRKGFGAGVDGAMTRQVRAPARILHAIPDRLPFDRAALTEPCCVAYNAVVENSSVRPGDRVVTLGPGPIGLLCAIMAARQGAESAIVGLESDADRLAVASRYGVEPVVGDPTPWACEADGLGADGVIDATGVSAALETALQIVRPAGWITKVGWGPQPLGVSLDPLVQKNVRLQGSFSHHWTLWEKALRMMDSGALDVAPLIGGVWPLAEWKTAFETMRGRSVVKSVITPE